MPQIEVAVGWDNAASAKPFDQLSSPLFASYKNDVLVGSAEWHNSEGRQLSASKRLKRVGRPYCILTFPYLSYCEFELLTSEGLINSTGDELVTAHLFNKFDRTWNWYNARLTYEDDYEDQYDVYNLKLQFRELEVTIP